MVAAVSITPYFETTEGYLLLYLTAALASAWTSGDAALAITA